MSENNIAAERLEALATVVKGIPWDDVDSLDIDWKTIEYSSGSDTLIELLPTLHVEMKAQMS